MTSEEHCLELLTRLRQSLRSHDDGARLRKLLAIANDHITNKQYNRAVRMIEKIEVLRKKYPYKRLPIRRPRRHQPTNRPQNTIYRNCSCLACTEEIAQRLDEGVLYSTIVASMVG